MAVLLAALWIECLLGLLVALTLGRYSLAGWTGRCHNTCIVCVLAGTWCSRLHSLVSDSFYNRHRTDGRRSCSTGNVLVSGGRCCRVLGTDKDNFRNLHSTCRNCLTVDRLDIDRHRASSDSTRNTLHKLLVAVCRFYNMCKVLGFSCRQHNIDSYW